MSRKIVDVSIEPPKGLTEIASQVKGEINKKMSTKLLILQWHYVCLSLAQ